jgi:hypothetical protein
MMLAKFDGQVHAWTVALSSRECQEKSESLYS